MIDVELLVIGGGGQTFLGGGGAGEYIHKTNYSVSEEATIPVIVGAVSEDTEFQSVVAKAGGDGGNGSLNGEDGGSGGGGGANEDNETDGSGGSAVPNEGLGNPGGSGDYGAGVSAGEVGGGGGGADTSGGNASSNEPGDGGNGVQNDITGTQKYYAGGKSGTGSGGDDGLGADNYGGGDQKGVVIVRYHKDDFASASTGGIKTTDGDYVVHTFENDGTLDLKQETLPAAQTNPAQNIKNDGASIYGEITDDGNQLEIPEFGFVYGTTSQSDPGNTAPRNTSYDDFFIRDGIFSENDQFVLGLSNLDENTDYYFRAYTKNMEGYSYGSELSFKTKYNPPIIESIEPTATLINTTPEVTINGKEFRAGLTVEVDGTSCTNITVVDEQTITCTVPSSAEQKSSTLTVTNDDGKSDSIEFYYVEEAPDPTQPDPVNAEADIIPIGVTM